MPPTPPIVGAREVREVLRGTLYRFLYPLAVLIHRLTGEPPPRPPFDQRRAQALLGKSVIIGLTYTTGEVVTDPDLECTWSVTRPPS